LHIFAPDKRSIVDNFLFVLFDDLVVLFNIDIEVFLEVVFLDLSAKFFNILVLFFLEEVYTFPERYHQLG
jgi:hypothetical protein